MGFGLRFEFSLAADRNLHRNQGETPMSPSALHFALFLAACRNPKLKTQNAKLKTSSELRSDPDRAKILLTIRLKEETNRHGTRNQY